MLEERLQLSGMTVSIGSATASEHGQFANMDGNHISFPVTIQNAPENVVLEAPMFAFQIITDWRSQWPAPPLSGPTAESYDFLYHSPVTGEWFDTPGSQAFGFWQAVSLSSLGSSWYLDLWLNDDQLPEGNESFDLMFGSQAYVACENASGDSGYLLATIATPYAVGTILDDDPPLLASIGDVTVNEAAGFAEVPVSVTLPETWVDDGVTWLYFNYEIQEGSASGSNDYTAAGSGTLTLLGFSAFRVPSDSHCE